VVGKQANKPAVAIALGMALAGALVGVGCGPGSLRSVEEGRRYPVSCASNEIRVCLGRCVVPAQNNEPCTPSPNAAAECSATFVPCAVGLSCVSGPGAIAPRCLPALSSTTSSGITPPAGNGDLQRCDPTLPRGSLAFSGSNLRANACTNNNVCMRTLPGSLAASCQRIDIGASGVSDPTSGLCVTAALDGETCDADWDDAITTAGTPTTGSLTCRPCMPGLTCVNNRCARLCMTGPSSVGSLAAGLGSCPRDRSSGPDDVRREYACRPLYSASAPTAAEAAAGLSSTFAISLGAPISGSPNTVCATCAAVRERCGVDAPTTMDPREVITAPGPSLPAIPMFLNGFGPRDRVPFQPSLSTSSLATAMISPSSGGGALPSRVNVPNAGSPSGQWVANPLCCSASQQCLNGQCCVPPAPPGGPVPACNSDADCCPFAVSWRNDPRQDIPPVQFGPAPRVFHQLCMSVSNEQAGADRTGPARTIYSEFRSLQSNGCFARNCGGRGQTCCPRIAGLTATECNPGFSCDSSDNTCQPRCADCDRCPVGELCRNGHCRLIPAAQCGQRGQPCCAPGVDGAVAADGCNEMPLQSFCRPILLRRCGDPRPAASCAACGQQGESCCPNRTCGTGLLCDNENRCATDTRCGGQGQPCCEFIGGRACNNPNTLACVNNRCQSCGGIGQVCCGGLHAPNSCRDTAAGGVSCNMPSSDDASGPLCEACGGAGAACCYSFGPNGGVVASCNSTALTCQPTGRVGRRTCQ
jgi:hypothetical protein